MLARLLAAFVLLTPVAFGQSGIYGTAAGHPKAGDAAPDLVFSKVLSAPGPGAWTQTNLSGQVTVLGFFPDTSHNPKPVADWNARVDEFAKRHVQFVWITGEDQRTLMPALAQHPIKGWVLYDPGGATAKAFGLDMPVNVYIGTNRKIVGYDQGFVPDEQTLNAVLDNRVVLTRPTPETITNFRESDLVALDAVPARMPGVEDHRPKLTPSDTVHITSAAGIGRGNFSADDYWVLKGFTLRKAIEEIYGVNSARLELPVPVDTAKRYDFAMLLPHAEQHGEMKERFKQALQQYFHLSVEREARLTNVYVVSVAPGQKARIEQVSERELGGGSAVDVMAVGDSAESASRPQGLDALFGVAEEDATMDGFCRDLESALDRPVVNETHLEGRYRFQVHTPVDSKASFATVLRERTGLVIGPAQRRIVFLKFKTVDERSAKVGAVRDLF